VRIALACHNFPPEFQGGTERVTLALARALAADGDHVVVISGSDQPHRGSDAEREDGLGLPVFRIRRKPDEGYGLELNRARIAAVVAALLREHAIEVLHVHHWATLTTRLARTARAAGCGVIATLHDTWTTCPRFFRRPPAGIECPTGEGRESCAPCVRLSIPTQPLWGLRLAIANRDRELQQELAAAHCVTVPSRTCADAIRAHVPWTGPLEVVPHGLLEPVRRPHAGDTAPRAPFRVGTFGNLVAEKGVALLADAMAGIEGAELHLFGAFLDPDFERDVQRRAEGRVALHCHGAYDAADGHPARELDLAVFPSLCHESYGLVVEEALARGVPVVVSDAGALAERIGAGGELVRAGDVGALHDVLRALVHDPARYRALRRGVPQRFASIADAARRYREMYAAAVAAGAEAPA
jgi:glycosyltransferase involved in cell wall biosynthesis